MRALRAALVSVWACAACWAQEQVGPVRGTDVNGYNIVDSIETGYRFAVVNGDRDQYKSTVNYGNGIRLLNSSFMMNSRSGHGRYFDEILLTTQGLGNDPYESATFRIQKNRAYRYDLLWRSNDYFNPGFVVSGGLHRWDIRHRWQDHDLLLMPQSKIRVRAGYSRTAQDGAALTTVPFTNPSDVFPVFADVKRQWNEYRLGAEVDLPHVRLTVLRRWEFYKEDSPLTLAAAESGTAANDPTLLTSFYRAEPYHGSTPGWLVNVLATSKRFAVNGRFTQSSGNRGFIQAENAAGLSLQGVASNRQITVAGNAQRPVVTGDATLSWFPSDRVTVVNSTAFRNIRIDGNSAYTEFDNSVGFGTTLLFEFLGIRLIENSTDAHYRVAKTLDVYGGYRYASREVRSIDNASDPTTPFVNTVNTVDNYMHAGVAGVNWTPLQSLRVRLEGEVGRNDHPLSPTADANYHTINAMVQYRVKPIQFRSGYKQNYNNNSVIVTAYSSRSRNAYADLSWTPRTNWSIDSSYSHLHLDTLGGIAFFAGAGRPKYITGFDSLYVSNIHAANIGVHTTWRKRTDVYLGYSITRDVGDGRPTNMSDSGSIAGLLSSVQTFPLTYQSPLARVSVRLRERLRWNAGYQFYGYAEDFGLFNRKQNFRAHTGYTSVTWAF